MNLAFSELGQIAPPCSLRGSAISIAAIYSTRVVDPAKTSTACSPRDANWNVV